MNQTADNSAPATAPHLAATIILAIGVIIVLHYAGFHFVVAGGAGR